MGFFSNSFFLIYKYESSSSSMSHAVLKTQRRKAASPGRQACAVRQQGRRARCRALQWEYPEQSSTGPEWG